MLLEEWCQGPPLFGMLRLNRSKLTEFLKIIENLPCVYRLDQSPHPLPWIQNEIAGVHQFLKHQPSPPLPENQKPIPTKKTKEVPSSIVPLHVDGSTQFLSIALPSKNSKSYDAALELLKENKFQLEPSNRRWWLRDKHRVLNFLANYWEHLKTDLNAVFSKNFQEKTAKIKIASIDCITSEDLSINLTLRTPGFDENAIRENLARSQYYAESEQGSITLVPPNLLEKLIHTQRELTGDAQRPLASKFSLKLNAAQLPYSEDLIEDLLGEKLQTPETWQIRSEALKEVGRLKMPDLPEALYETLRGYQRIGVAWIYHLYNNELGGILADEMGLGKTVQALAFIYAISQNLSDTPSLVICPAGLVENWRREAKKFIPSCTVFCHHGQNRLQSFDLLSSYNLIITSYQTLIRDIDLFYNIDFNAVIADEAQHIKNRYTQNSRALKKLNAKGRILLTGTPIENSLDDLRSLFEFLMPGYLLHLPSNIKREERKWHDDRVRVQVAPYILRRSKALVAPELPEKIQKTVFCEMDPIQSTLYRDYKEKAQKAIFELEMSGSGNNKIHFIALTHLLRMRQICADPRLIDEKISAENSAKLRALKEIIEESIDGNHRMLIFSQFVSVLQLLKQELDSQNIPYCYLDGETKNRLEVCDLFNSDESIPIFLISLKAGGVGLNLTGADTVVHFDPWWNPAVEAQATDRTHRIGQKKIVTNIKLIVSDTIEEKVLDLQKQKAHLLEDLFDSSDTANSKIGLDDIKALIT
ncbi:MAG: ATP-dependent helicase [Verrucomicrobia bacterium]|nr:MAG: ATP-dependent helicase [Verrucomicrobiota bacterium]